MTDLSSSNTPNAHEARLEQLRRYLLVDPMNPVLLQEAVEVALRAGQAGVAAELLAPALLAHPTDAGLLFQRGTVALAQMDYALAQSLFQGLLAEGHHHPAIAFNAALAGLQLGNVAAAQALLEGIDPAVRADAVPDADALLARCWYLGQHYEEAIALLEAVVARRPHDAAAWGLLALVAWDFDAVAKAEQAARQAVALHPDQSDALLTLGSLALEQQDGDLAESLFTRLTIENAANGRAWSGLGYAQMLQMRHAEAEGCFAEAVVQMPDHIGTWHGLAWMQLLRGDLDAAQMSAQRAMDLDRNFADSHGTLAVITVLRGGQDAEAQLMIRRGLGLNRNCGSALYAQMLLQARSKQPHASVEQLLAQISAGMGLPEGAGLQAMAARVAQRVKTPPQPRRLQ